MVNYDYLCEFASIVREGSLAAASRAIGVSEPSLSRHLGGLERALGVRLLKRGTSGVELTDDGERVLGIARQIEAIESGLRTRIAELALCPTRERTLIVRCSDSLRKPLRLLHAAASRHDGSEVSLRVESPGSREVALSALARNSADVILGLDCSLGAHDPQGCMRLRLCELPVALVLSPSHPLAAQAGIVAEDLRSLRFLPTPGSLDGWSASWVEFRSLCRERGFLPNAVPLHYNNRFGFGVRGADEVSICQLDSPQADLMRRQGYDVRAVNDLRFVVYALIRTDDAEARELVEHAARIGTGDEKASASHESMYGQVARDDDAGEDLTYESRGRLLARALDEPTVSEDLVLPDGTVVDRAYVALRNRLNRIADGLGNDPVETSYELISSLWSVEEAQAELEMPLLQWFDAYDWAASSGRSLQECEELLDRLSRRGLIYRVTREGVSRYFLMAWVYGIWESSVQRYDLDFLTSGIYGSDAGARSWFPIMHACPVGPEVIEDGVLQPYRDWQGYVERQSLACVAPCQCRRAEEIERGGISERPSEVCLTFGEMARYWIENGGGRQVTMDEARAIARHAAYDDGLVPQLYFSKDPQVLCFCHGDDCYVLSTIKSTGGLVSSMESMSAYELVYDERACVGCGACEARCPMGCVTLDEGGVCHLGPTCVACGQCALVCPVGARRLRPKARDQVCELPADMLESYQWRSEDRMARGHISDFTGTTIDPWAGASW